MKKFKVSGTGVISFETTVEASTAQEALKIAAQLAEDAELDESEWDYFAHDCVSNLAIDKEDGTYVYARKRFNRKTKCRKTK